MAQVLRSKGIDLAVLTGDSLEAAQKALSYMKETEQKKGA